MATLNEDYYLSWASVMMPFETCLFDILVSFWVCFTKKVMDGGSHVRWNQWALIIFLWLNRVRVSVCLCCGWVKPVNWAWYFCPWCRSEWECESFFFSLQAASVCLTPRGHQSDESERARGPHGERANAVCGGCVERGPSVFCSPPGARPSEMIWTPPCPTCNVESVYPSKSDSLACNLGCVCTSEMMAHDHRAAEGRSKGSFSLINITQTLLCSHLQLCPKHTHTFTARAPALASHSSDGARVEREHGNQGDGW